MTTKTQQIEQALREEAATMYGFESWSEAFLRDGFSKEEYDNYIGANDHYTSNRDMRIARAFAEWINAERYNRDEIDGTWIPKKYTGFTYTSEALFNKWNESEN